MEKKISRRAQQRAKRMELTLDSIKKRLDAVSPETMRDLFRRDDGAPFDGRSGTSGGIRVMRTGTHNVGSSVENAVMLRMSKNPPKDLFSENLIDIEKTMIRIEGDLARIKDIVDKMNGVEEKKKDARRKPGLCEICSMFESVRTGMCVVCYQEWLEAGSPDLSKWRMFKLGQRNSEGLLLMDTPPPPKKSV